MLFGTAHSQLWAQIHWVLFCHNCPSDLWESELNIHISDCRTRCKILPILIRILRHAPRRCLLWCCCSHRGVMRTPKWAWPLFAPGIFQGMDSCNSQALIPKSSSFPWTGWWQQETTTFSKANKQPPKIEQEALLQLVSAHLPKQPCN